MVKLFLKIPELKMISLIQCVLILQFFILA